MGVAAVVRVTNIFAPSPVRPAAEQRDAVIGNGQHLDDHTKQRSLLAQTQAPVSTQGRCRNAMVRDPAHGESPILARPYRACGRGPCVALASWARLLRLKGSWVRARAAPRFALRLDGHVRLAHSRSIIRE
jgi:hypothetical protein